MLNVPDQKNVRALLVHNANAGTDPVPRHEIERVLSAANLEVTYCEHGSEDLRRALATDFDLVVAAGGDGTFADVVSTLELVDRPVGVLPMGGSNNIARSLGIEDDWRQLPARWSLDYTALLDRCEVIGPWGSRPFVETVGAGLLTRSFEQVDDEPDNPSEKRANGRLAFRNALGSAEPFHCHLTADDWSWEGECLFVEVMNIALIGPRLPLARSASPSDGFLDLVLALPEDVSAMVEWACDPEALPCPIIPRRVRNVKLTVEGVPLRVDDRCPRGGLSGTATIRMRSQPVQILIPREIQP